MTREELLNRFDRKKVAPLLILSAMVLFFFLVLLPLKERSGELDRKLLKAGNELDEMEKLSTRYKELSKLALPTVGWLGGNLGLVGKIEKIAERSGTKKNLKTVSPSGKSGDEVTVTISGMNLYSLVAFLEVTRSSGSGLSVVRAKIQTTFEDRDSLEAELLLKKVL